MTTTRARRAGGFFKGFLSGSLLAVVLAAIALVILPNPAAINPEAVAAAVERSSEPVVGDVDLNPASPSLDLAGAQAPTATEASAPPDPVEPGTEIASEETSAETSEPVASVAVIETPPVDVASTPATTPAVEPEAPALSGVQPDAATAPDFASIDQDGALSLIHISEPTRPY